MQQLEQALSVLSKQGIHINSWQAINGGINSQIFRLTNTQGQAFALKFYKSVMPGDERNRLQAEQDFLTHINSTEASEQTPKLIYANPNQNWSLLSWLDGQQVNALEKGQLAQITNFIAKSNPGSSKAHSNLNPASEACLSHQAISQNLKNRLIGLIAIKSQTILEAKVSHWIQKILKPAISQQLVYFEQLQNSPAWQPQAIQLIASPSDVGIHNTLTHNGKLYFLDFEYSGADDLAKLACDWVLQPKQPLSHELEQFFLNNLKLKTQYISPSWVERYQALKPILALKWVTIMLNKHLKNNLDLQQFDKAKSYYERIINNRASQA